MSTPSRSSAEFLRDLRGLVLDMDGVLWRGGSPLPGLAALFGVLRERGLPYVLATNNAGRTPDQYRDRLAGFGVSVPLEAILSSALVTAEHLARQLGPGAAVYMIGQDGLREALEQAGLRIVGGAETPVAAVVVGFDRGLSYAKLAEAALHLQRPGVRFVGTNGDASYPAEGGRLLPGNGAVLAALSKATGRRPRLIGKPERPIFAAALRRLGCEAGAAAVVGDRLDTDILGGRRAGLRTILVTSGVDDAAAVARGGVRPDLVLPDIAALAAGLAALGTAEGAGMPADGATTSGGAVPAPLSGSRRSPPGPSS